MPLPSWHPYKDFPPTNNELVNSFSPTMSIVGPGWKMREYGMNALSPAEVCDPYWKDVVSLIQPTELDTNGSTNIVDIKGHALTLNGGTVITTNSGFPGIVFDGADNSIVLATHADYAFGTTDFSIDMYLLPLAYGGTVAGSTLWGTTNGTTTGYSFHLGQDQSSMCQTSDLTGTWADNLVVSAGGGPVLNYLSHLAIERFGNTLTIYKNGSVTAQMTGASGWNYQQGAIVIGRFWDGGVSRYLNGILRNIRATRVARWRGNPFSAPAFNFPVR